MDVGCGGENEWAVSVQGMGGRQVREEPDQLFDHYAAEFSFGDGTRMAAQARHMTNCWDFFGDLIQGTKGCAVLGEGQPTPRIFKGHKPSSENLVWNYKGPGWDHYQYEHDLLFDAIRSDKPYNETERCAKSCLTAIMGRMACESGKQITWAEAFASEVELAPGLADLKWDADPPAKPDAGGRYEVAMPGRTRAC